MIRLDFSLLLLGDLCVEIGIVSEGEEEDARTRGQWRVMDTAEIEQHLLAYAEKD